MSLWAIDSPIVELRPNATEDDLQLVIRAVYRQVLGNEHLMESERLDSAESLLRNGDITVSQFVRLVAKSDLYRALFFESTSQYRFIELNFKHLLGRAPIDQAEISQHVRLYNDEGYDAEIDSYIDSDEYIQNFGENIVPYPRATRSQIGLSNVVFNRTFVLDRGAASSDGGSDARLIASLAANLPVAIKAPAPGSAAAGNTAKRFRIQVSKSNAGPRVRYSNIEYVVNYEQLSHQVQNIHKAGGTIVSISEVA
ncbi:phycobilisome rod-core linker polypeptide [Gloeobacter kilaueensis]|uniref:Phycobilisome linker polypeptide n=1 Tax=Gloeobacter kilaueensis (strain ATCC BAA-2537 / CCAP 1431/1 / ULC 316 / JS1) TaxID=1183438 RepID=U5QNP4_GLOK1|nr:phycobilisome rod-core linker polypeptide [Gloeobacter kilaueensis]AGY60546.1 phycobilisome linker polypeptide [Gloeobacter kilaueensis JS1]